MTATSSVKHKKDTLLRQKIYYNDMTITNFINKYDNMTATLQKKEELFKIYKKKRKENKFHV